MRYATNRPACRTSKKDFKKKKQLPTTLAHLYNKHTLLVQSAPLGLLQQILHPLLSPKTQYTARMLVDEVKTRRTISPGPTYHRPHFLRANHTWLEIGIVDDAATALPIPIRYRATETTVECSAQQLPEPQARREPMSKSLFDIAYFNRLKRRRSVVPRRLKTNLFVGD